MDIILAYSPSINRFVDEQDIVVHDIYSLLDHWQVQTWLRSGGKDTIVQAKTGDFILLVYLTDEEEEDLFDFLGFQESFGMPTDRATY